MVEVLFQKESFIAVYSQSGKYVLMASFCSQLPATSSILALFGSFVTCSTNLHFKQF